MQVQVQKRIVRINAVPRTQVDGRSLIGPRSPSPTAQISRPVVTVRIVISLLWLGFGAYNA
jgi:hypothetical protein